MRANLLSLIPVLYYYLVPVVDVTIGKGSSNQLVENNSIGVDIRLETVGIGVLHSNNFRCLREPRGKVLGSGDREGTTRFLVQTIGSTRISFCINTSPFPKSHLTPCSPSKVWTHWAVPPAANHSIESSLWQGQSHQSSLSIPHAGKCLRT